jgi:hypothetical protein
MGAHNSRPRGFPADLRASMTKYLNRGFRAVTMHVYIDGELDLRAGSLSDAWEVDALVEKCEGRRVRVENIEWHFIGDTCDFGFHDEREVRD